MEAQGSNKNEENIIGHEIKTLSFHLGEIKILKNFAESLQSLYYHKKLNRSLTDNKSNDVLEYEKILDETRNNAVKYVKSHLPKVENLLTSIQTLFEYYNSFSDEEWLKDINEDIKESKKIAEEVQEIHELIKLEERPNTTKAVVKKLKKNEDLKTQINKWEKNAKVVMTNVVQHVDHSSKPNECSEFFSNHEEDIQQKPSGSEKKQQKENTTHCHKKEDVQLEVSSKSGFRKKQNENATHFYKEGDIQQEDSHHFESKAKEYLAKATAFQKEIDLRQKNVSVVNTKLIDSLQHYINSVCGITEFIFFLEKDISCLLGSKNDLEKYRKHHFQVMKEKSKEIVHKIQEFFGFIPDIRSTIKAVPNNANDKNFVDEWLQSKLKEIEKETGVEMSSSTT
ncbi:uncharacterized protein LOC124437556 [Xenia sp. Carnegie-2017]|uniref:uncharacterized protein LOC124437556 n=1 Tax=Xenia sp. Carnegie-2017 TaxID=2897299 RepID=UPI001F03591F|nr:uncharacterized protein LOC124437556 [Xenia sp. Carnegie-2017]XP_046843477.1 uncharacterized protein LOC124437556 [Xenia sp. Carnegie-2017]XP_046843478.1 uncharacterized protein LOC124437556 [Xenia sp. Carnegie-2017]